MPRILKGTKILFDTGTTARKLGAKQNVYSV
jgi:hypothetical protein